MTVEGSPLTSPASTRREWEVLVDEAMDATDGYEATCAALGLTSTGADKHEVMRTISGHIKEMFGEDSIKFVDIEALRDAEDAVVARAAEARYRMAGPNELSDFDQFVHPSEERQ